MLKKHFISFLLLSFVFPVYANTENPEVLLQQVANRMVDFLELNKEKLETDENLAKQIVRQELLPLIDLDGLGHRLLKRKIWNELSSNQKQRFTNAFVNHLIDTYAKGLAKYDGHQFEFLKTEYTTSETTAYIYSQLKSKDNESYSIIYTMKQVGEELGWRVIDISIEGIKILQNYREQLKSFELSDGFDALLAKIEGPQSE